MAEFRVIPDAGERSGMKHLEKQRADAADHHRREVAMDLPGDRALSEEAVVPARLSSGRLSRAGPNQLVDLLSYRSADCLHPRHGGRPSATTRPASLKITLNDQQPALL